MGNGNCKLNFVTTSLNMPACGMDVGWDPIVPNLFSEILDITRTTIMRLVK
jgi:hypothetical protein